MIVFNSVSQWRQFRRTRLAEPVGAERIQACNGATSGTYRAVSAD